MALWNNPEKQARVHERQAGINAQKAWSSNPNIAAKGMLGMDIARMQSGNLGLSQAEQNQLSEASTQQAGAGLEAQNQEIAQQGLASGGGAGPSARYAALQRSMGRNLAGGAIPSTDGSSPYLSGKEAVREARHRRPNRWSASSTNPEKPVLGEHGYERSQSDWKGRCFVHHNGYRIIKWQSSLRLNSNRVWIHTVNRQRHRR